MNIGIIGYGKMGKEIFSLFFDKLPDANFRIYDIAPSEKNTADVLKTLGKSLKRKKSPRNSTNPRRIPSSLLTAFRI